MNPVGLAMIPITLACSHGVFGNTCDVDIQCMSWLKMYGCYRRYNDKIQTPAYLEALRLGRNIPAKIAVEPHDQLDFLFSVR